MKTTTLPDGTASYTAADGEMLDQIADLYYGTTVDTLELLYSVNTGLAARGLLLAAGDVVILPPKPVTSIRATISLWD